MILTRIARSMRNQDWTVVAIEFVIVVAGILLALQVDQWVGERAERALEREYLERLADDLEIERERMLDGRSFGQGRLEAIHFLREMAAAPASAEADPGAVTWALETVTWRTFPQVNAFVFRELQSTGNLMLIRSVPLRRALAQHYTQIEHDARVGEDRGAQLRFEEATAGLATIEELMAVERADGLRGGLTLDPARAREIADDFAGRPAARAQLPSLAQHLAFNLKVIDNMIARTGTLIEQVDVLLANEGDRR